MLFYLRFYPLSLWPYQSIHHYFEILKLSYYLLETLQVCLVLLYSSNLKILHSYIILLQNLAVCHFKAKGSLSAVSPLWLMVDYWFKKSEDLFSQPKVILFRSRDAEKDDTDVSEASLTQNRQESILNQWQSYKEEYD